MRLAHISDLHLLSLEGAKFLDFASKRWIGGLNLLTNRGRHYHTEIFEALISDLNEGRADHVLCTGDITNLALEDEFRFARGLFDRFTLGPESITVIPGNHDAYVAEGARYFSRYFQPFFQSDEPASEAWPLARVRDRVAILGLSTSLQTPWFTAYGVIGDRQLAALADALVDEKYQKCFKIVAIHHPPAGPPAKSVIRGLRDRDKLAALLREVGADLVLHGHEHRDLFYTLQGPDNREIPVRGIHSSTHESGNIHRRARYRIYEIDEGQVQGEEVRIWNPASKGFELDSSSLQPAA